MTRPDDPGAPGRPDAAGGPAPDGTGPAPATLAGGWPTGAPGEGGATDAPGEGDAERRVDPGTRRRLAVVAAVGVAVLLLAVGLHALTGGPEADAPPPPLASGALAERVQETRTDADAEGADAGETAVEALRYRESEADELTERATLGFSQPLFTRVPGGAEATVARVGALRPRIEAAAEAAGEDPDLLEAMVYLESAGNPDAMATDDVQDASGLVQILAETGQNLLDMRIDVEASERLTRRIRRGRGDVDALRARRARIDERFDVDAALAAATRYLDFARGELGDREDLAVTSYHMGVGNLTDVLERYEGGADAAETPYVRLYFDSDPQRNPGAWRILQDFSDDSSTYWWRVLAARRIMALSREDPAALRREADLRSRKASAEELLQPPQDAPTFPDPAALARAQRDGDVLPLPRRVLRTNGLRIDPDMGELARRVGQEPERYRGLRPGALATLVTIGAAVQELSGTEPLTVTSTVRDDRYQSLLRDETVQATSNRSLHATGSSVDIARDYEDDRQALRFQFVLDRLQALNLIAWVREPGAIHLTASPEAEERLGGVLRVALGE